MAVGLQSYSAELVVIRDRTWRGTGPVERRSEEAQRGFPLEGVG